MRDGGHTPDLSKHTVYTLYRREVIHLNNNNKKTKNVDKCCSSSPYVPMCTSVKYIYPSHFLRADTLI